MIGNAAVLHVVGTDAGAALHAAELAPDGSNVVSSVVSSFVGIVILLVSVPGVDGMSFSAQHTGVHHVLRVFRKVSAEDIAVVCSVGPVVKLFLVVLAMVTVCDALVLSTVRTGVVLHAIKVASGVIVSSVMNYCAGVAIHLITDSFDGMIFSVGVLVLMLSSKYSSRAIC